MEVLFPELISIIIKEKNVDLNTLSSKTGIPYTSILRFCSSKNVPSVPDLISIMLGLDLTFSEMLVVVKSYINYEGSKHMRRITDEFLYNSMFTDIIAKKFNLRVGWKDDIVDYFSEQMHIEDRAVNILDILEYCKENFNHVYTPINKEDIKADINKTIDLILSYANSSQIRYFRGLLTFLLRNINGFTAEAMWSIFNYIFLYLTEGYLHKIKIQTSEMKEIDKQC